MVMFTFFIAKMISVALDLMIYVMIGRCLLPLFTNPEESRLYYFLCVISEPIILPVRYILQKFNWFQKTPIDAGFFITYIALIIIQLFLPAI